MHRYTLRESVTVSGRNVCSLPTEVRLEPTTQRGIWWQLSTGERVLIQKATLGANTVLRYLTLSYNGEVLRIPEHLFGIIYAAGLDSLCIIPGRFGLPYDGSAGSFWNALRDVRTRSGTLDAVTPMRRQVIKDGRKNIAIDRGDAAELLVVIEVHYVGKGKVGVPFFFTTIDLDLLATAKPYGRWWWKLPATCTGRAKLFEWLDGDAASIKRGLMDIARHRLLDLFGMLLHASPVGARLAGHMTMQFAGHPEDVQLDEKLRDAYMHILEHVP